MSTSATSVCSQRDDFDLRSIGEWAIGLGIPSDMMVEAGRALGKWWLKDPTSQTYGHDAHEIEWFLRSLGLVSVLGEVPERCPGVESPVVRRSREADIERIVQLIDTNHALLADLKWSLFVGQLLHLIADSKAAMRVVRDRGILVSDVEAAILRSSKFACLVPTGGLVPSVVVREMKRMHRARLGFLWLNQEDEANPLVSCLDRRPVEKKAHTREFDAPEYAVGEIVWAAMEEVTNGRKSRRKHPVLLLSLTGHRNDKWIVVSLTSDVDGDPEHRRVTDHEVLGLIKGGYVWHETQKIHASQIETHVGWVSRDLVRVVDASVNLCQTQIENLNRVADRRHSSEQKLQSV